MSRASALARGQAAAQAGMRDACTITRVNAGGTTNPDTGYPSQSSTTRYTGQCRVQQHQASADMKNLGEDQVFLLRVEVQLPVSVTGLKVGDLATITAASTDVDLVGRVFRIHDLAHKTDLTARRPQCVEVTGS